MLETIVVFAGIPLAIYGLVSVVTLRSRNGGVTRYRPGQPWEHAPLWWTANPAGVGEQRQSAGASAVTGSVKGGARGNW
ncbi:hypothetical protein EWH70_32795 [Amycolatopsis suaedae]|uniref:Uncharacterized protein n=2 Tax=Amycolatopsis suaedae TaxID=2510978 RepID=A0A4Q7J035_9PSEU|nr:hypothetical protein EWH70_32795 [Amycolatopsis suaedae]